MPAVWTPGIASMRWRTSRSKVATLAAVSTRRGVVEEDGGGAGWLEAEVDVEDAEEAAQEQAGADEEDAGEGDFGDDEGGAEALVFAAVAGAGAGILERVLQIAAGRF